MIASIEVNPHRIEVTVKDAYEALVKNGFEHLRGKWTTVNADGTILGGCVLGQTAVNLGVVPNNSGYSLASQLNDAIRVPYAKLPAKIRGTGGESMGLGDLLVTMNDLRTKGDDKYWYSWKDLVRAAKRFMEPNFDKKLSLITYDFKLPESMKETVNA